MEENKSSLWKNALNWGVIMGIVSIVLSVLMYMLDFNPTNFSRIIISMIISLTIFIIVLIFAMKAYRNELGDALTYGQAFTFGFFVILISSFISSLYSYVFLSLIDPGYLKMVYDATLSSTEEFLLNRGLSQDQVDKAIEEASKQPIPTAFISTIKGFFSGVIGSTIITLIIAAIMKKNKPEIQFNEE